MSYTNRLRMILQIGREIIKAYREWDAHRFQTPPRDIPLDQHKEAWEQYHKRRNELGYRLSELIMSYKVITSIFFRKPRWDVWHYHYHRDRGRGYP